MKNTTHLITSLLLLLLPLFVTAQVTNNDCPFYKKYINTGDIALKKKNFEAAINAYSTAMVHCPRQAKIASSKIKIVFKAINQQRIEAEKAKERATKSEKRALIEKEKAVKAQKIAYSNQLAATSSNALYVYGNNSDALHIAKAAIDSAYTPAAALALSTAYYKMFDNGALLAANWTREKDSINTAIFSPDGQFILTYSESKQSKLWNLEGDLISDFSGQNANVITANFSPNGAYIITCLDDNSVQTWDIKGNRVLNFDNKTPQLSTAYYSPNNQYIITETQKNIAQLWNLNGELLEEFSHRSSTYELKAIQFSEDGNRILINESENQLAIYDIKKANLIRLEHNAPISTAQFSPDGQFVLTNSGYTARLWDKEGQIKVDWGPILDRIHFVENSDYLIYREQIKLDEANELDSIKIWNTNGQLIQQLSKKGLEASNVTFSSDYNYMLTNQHSKSVQLRDFKGEVLMTLPINDEVSFQGFSADNKYIFTQTKGNKAVKIWNLDGHFITELNIELDISMIDSYFLPVITVSSDGQHILITKENEIGDIDKSEVWNRAGKQVIDFVKQNCKSNNLPVFSPNGKYILANCYYKIELWTTEGAILTDEQSTETTFFSPNHQYFVTESENNKIQLRNIKNNFVADLKDSDVPYFWVAFSPNEKYLVLNIDNQPLSLWNIDGTHITDLKGNDKKIFSVNFDSDGASILASVENDKAILWDLNGQIIAHLDTLATFSPNRKQILTSSNGSPLKLWDTKGQLIKAFNENIALTHFSPSNQYFLTKSTAGFTQLWGINGQLIHTFTEKNPVTSPDFFPNQNYYLLYRNNQRLKSSWVKREFINEIDDLSSGFSSAVFSTKEKYLLIENRLYDIKGRFINQLGTSKKFSAVKFSSKDEYILTLNASSDTITLWDIKGNLIKKHPKEWQPFFKLKFAPQTDYFVIPSSYTASVYNKKGNLIKSLKGVEWFDGKFTYSPNGQILLFLSCNPHNCDSKIKLWNLKNGYETDLNKHTSAIHKVKFSPDGKYILTAAYDNTIKLWDLEGNLLANLNKHEGYSSRISFSSDSQFIITQATTLKIWPTPQAIYQYLEDEPLPLLTEEKLKKYGMK